MNDEFPLGDLMKGHLGFSLNLHPIQLFAGFAADRLL